MTFNSVTVNAQWTDGTTAGEGNFCFAAQGNFMDSPSIAIVTPVIIGQLDKNGSLWDGTTLGSGVKLLASDNFTAGDLVWHMLVRVRGEPDIDVGQIAVNYATGASQPLFTILATAGWVAQPV